MPDEMARIVPSYNPFIPLLLNLELVFIELRGERFSLLERRFRGICVLGAEEVFTVLRIQ